MNLKLNKKKECQETKIIKERHQKFRDFLKNIQNNTTPSSDKITDLRDKLNPGILPVFAEKR